MDFKKLGTFIIVIGLILVVSSGIFYAMNIGEQVTAGVAFLAGAGNQHARELLEKKYNRQKAMLGFVPGVIVTLAGTGIFISAKRGRDK